MKQGDIVYYVSTEYYTHKKPVIFQAEFIRFVKSQIVEIKIITPDYTFINTKQVETYSAQTTQAELNFVFPTHDLAIQQVLQYFEETGLFIDHSKKYNEWLPKKRAADEQRKKSAEYAKKVGTLGLQYVFTFGKYKNCILETVVEKNPSYICWLHEDTDFKVELEIYKYCKKRAYTRFGGGYSGWDNVSSLEQDACISPF